MPLGIFLLLVGVSPDLVLGAGELEWPGENSGQGKRPGGAWETKEMQALPPKCSQMDSFQSELCVMTECAPETSAFRVEIFVSISLLQAWEAPVWNGRFPSPGGVGLTRGLPPREGSCWEHAGPDVSAGPVLTGEKSLRGDSRCPPRSLLGITRAAHAPNTEESGASRWHPRSWPPPPSPPSLCPDKRVSVFRMN